jgi:hypothetical protein
MPRWFAALVLMPLACAPAARTDPTAAPPATLFVQPRPVATGPAAPPLSAAVPAQAPERVWLLLQDGQGSGWSRCAADVPDQPARCAPIPELQGARVTQVDRNQFLARDAAGGSTWLWNAATGQKIALAAPAGDVEYRLRDGTLVHFEYRPNYTPVFTSQGGPWTPAATHDRLRSNDARFLPDGRTLFKSSPAMGGPESSHYIDVLIGHPTYLYTSSSIGGQPHRLATGPQFMHADLVDSGRFAVYFNPGDVDKAANTRSFSVEAIDVSTSAVKRLSVVKMPVTLQRPGGTVYLRSAPESVAFPEGPWFLHGLDHDAMGRAVSHRLQDVVSGAAVDLDEVRVGSLVPSVPAGMLPIGSSRRWSAHVVVRTAAELVVLALPSLQPVLRVPASEVRAADVIVP